VTEPLNRSQLRQMHPDRRADGSSGELEGMLDAMLAKHDKKREAIEAQARAAQQTRSPIDLIRDVVAGQLVPVVNQAADRYRPRGFDVSVDAADLLGGGRGLTLEISFGAHRLVLEGTAMPEGIAFNEVLYIGGQGGTVATGPMLRGARLSAQGFSDFLYERMIALVKSCAQDKPRP